MIGFEQEGAPAGVVLGDADGGTVAVGVGDEGDVVGVAAAGVGVLAFEGVVIEHGGVGAARGEVDEAEDGELFDHILASRRDVVDIGTGDVRGGVCRCAAPGGKSRQGDFHEPFVGGKVRRVGLVNGFVRAGY